MIDNSKNNISSIILKKIDKYTKIDKSSVIGLNTINFNDVDIIDSIDQIICLINFKIINNIRRINKFHEFINENIKLGSYYVICAETLEIRRIKINSQTIWGFKKLAMLTDFICKRIIPKLPIFKFFYFFITKGHNRVMSESEILGRMISCGFEILETFQYKGKLYVITKKQNFPEYNMKPSYGLLFSMKRLGKNGKIINLYKLRTMHPYSEYLQSYLYRKNRLNKDGDKILNDPRVTGWGKFFRKFWIDELPQLYNFLKGDISLVGVRAISKAKYDLYDDDLKSSRIKFKPGLIPPFYVDLPQNFKDFQESERMYLKSKSEKPISTDFKYFFKAIYNILFKGARSS